MSLTLKKEIQTKILEAQSLHQCERNQQIASIDLVGYFERVRAAVLVGLTTAAFAKRIGLTKDAYWKRAQAHRVLVRFPDMRALFLEGRITLSHLALVCGKITRANEDLMVKAVRDQTVFDERREVSKIQLDGTVLDDKEATITVQVNLTLE